MKILLSYICFSLLMLVILTLFNIVFSSSIEWVKNITISVITYPIYLFFDWTLGIKKK